MAASSRVANCACIAVPALMVPSIFPSAVRACLKIGFQDALGKSGDTDYHTGQAIDSGGQGGIVTSLGQKALTRVANRINVHLSRCSA